MKNDLFSILGKSWDENTSEMLKIRWPPKSSTGAGRPRIEISDESAIFGLKSSTRQKFLSGGPKSAIRALRKFFRFPLIETYHFGRNLKNFRRAQIVDWRPPDRYFWRVDDFRPKLADSSEISIGGLRSTIWGVIEFSTFQTYFHPRIFLKLRKGRFSSTRGAATGNKIFFGNIGYKMLLKKNPGLQNIFWRISCAPAQAFPAPKSDTFWKTDFPSKMGKMSAIIWLWGRNSLQNCTTTLKSSFRTLLSFVAGVT